MAELRVQGVQDNDECVEFRVCVVTSPEVLIHAGINHAGRLWPLSPLPPGVSVEASSITKAALRGDCPLPLDPSELTPSAHYSPARPDATYGSVHAGINTRCLKQQRRSRVDVSIVGRKDGELVFCSHNLQIEVFHRDASFVPVNLR
ncbi:unnamed protein product [Pleuronectes platessa]|uniref:Uncharacterized protein n=1 Tax=Pleuronectes platessa TaxID=8262 RepID=A0A9N7YPG0_PLEPL|nr:unnamed protein product [Pleuronectes platessa]